MVHKIKGGATKGGSSSLKKVGKTLRALRSRDRDTTKKNWNASF